MIVVLTGHRPEKLGGYQKVNPVRDVLKARLKVELDALGVTRWAGHVYTGMAQGFDMWGAELCRDVSIPFTAVIPFEGQELRWPAPAQHWYKGLLAAAETVKVVSAFATVSSFDIRNRWMVDRGDEIVTAYDGTAGGTRNCVEYAELKQKPVHNIWTPDIFGSLK